MGPHAEDTREEMLKQGLDFGEYLLGRNPYISLLAISGSLTNAQSVSHLDNDYFILCREGRVWECFASCLFWGFLYSRRIRKPRTYFCFNYIIDENHAKEEIRIDEKSARELLNLRVICGNAAYRRLLGEKPEVGGFFPQDYRDRLNAAQHEPDIRPSDGLPLLGIIKPFFKALSKLFEARRRARYGTMKIYSNDRVIRSHLH